MSVVIPVRNDSEMLSRCLAALGNQTRPADEIIVVDNGSDDDGADVARRFGATVITEPERGIAAAASAGYDAVSGSIIVRCDADTLPPPGWLAEIERILDERPDAVAVTGLGRFYDLSPLTRIIADVVYMRSFFLMMRVALGNNTVFGSNFALRTTQWRSIRDSVHRHDPLVHDDIDIGFHLHPASTVLVDARIRVGISGRPFSDAASLLLRTRRASHTARVHGLAESPLPRWMRRLHGVREHGGAGATATTPVRKYRLGRNESR